MYMYSQEQQRTLLVRSTTIVAFVTLVTGSSVSKSRHDIAIGREGKGFALAPKRFELLQQSRNAWNTDRAHFILDTLGKLLDRTELYNVKNLGAKVAFR
jgi:hypothetical protein